jgi:predicted RNA-binding Zn-ribbon protein involved in translation (DUF1610 family)
METLEEYRKRRDEIINKQHYLFHCGYCGVSSIGYVEDADYEKVLKNDIISLSTTTDITFQNADTLLFKCPYCGHIMKIPKNKLDNHKCTWNI